MSVVPIKPLKHRAKPVKSETDSDDDEVVIQRLETKEVKVDPLAALLKSSVLTVELVRKDPSRLLGFSPESLRLAKSLFFPASRVFHLNLGNVRAISTDSSGNWGGSSSGDIYAVTSALTGAAEWASAQALFDEVFVEAVHLHWQPHNRYTQYNLQASAASGSRFSVGVAIVSLHHGAATYSTYSAANCNPTLQYGYAGDPFTYVWKNIEKMVPTGPSSSVSGTAYIGQGWCNTNTTTVGGYGGQIQSIGCIAMNGYTTTVELGRAGVRIQCAFRNRA